MYKFKLSLLGALCAHMNAGDRAAKETEAMTANSDEQATEATATKATTGATTATEATTAADVDDELEAGDDWIPRGSQHEI